MPQVAVPAAFYRGGTSRAVMFTEADLASYSEHQRRRIILAALGSPDPYGREVDGLGGGISSLSKAAIVGPAPRDVDADVTFKFAQVDVERPDVAFSGNCGNISAAVGPFALEEGLVPAIEPVTTVRVCSVNTAQTYLCHVPVRDGQPEVEGDYSIDGVPGSGARIALEFLDPSGSAGRGLLPTDKLRDTLTLPDGREFEVSIVDAANPMVFVRASDLGATATESPELIDDDARLRESLEQIRDHAAVLMGLATSPPEARERAKAVPKVVMVAPPTSYRSTGGSLVDGDSLDLIVRMLSMGKTHRTMAGTAAICTAVAASLRGTVVHDAVRDAPPRALDAGHRDVRIGHPAGSLTIGVTLAVDHAFDRVELLSLRVRTYRTARRIMSGNVYVPTRYLEGRPWFEQSSRADRAPELVGVE